MPKKKLGKTKRKPRVSGLKQKQKQTVNVKVNVKTGDGKSQGIPMMAPTVIQAPAQMPYGFHDIHGMIKSSIGDALGNSVGKVGPISQPEFAGFESKQAKSGLTMENLGKLDMVDTVSNYDVYEGSSTYQTTTAPKSSGKSIPTITYNNIPSDISDNSNVSFKSSKNPSDVSQNSSINYDNVSFISSNIPSLGGMKQLENNIGELNGFIDNLQTKSPIDVLSNKSDVSLIPSEPSDTWASVTSNTTYNTMKSDKEKIKEGRESFLKQIEEQQNELEMINKREREKEEQLSKFINESADFLNSVDDDDKRLSQADKKKFSYIMGTVGKATHGGTKFKKTAKEAISREKIRLESELDSIKEKNRIKRQQLEETDKSISKLPGRTKKANVVKLPFLSPSATNPDMQKLYNEEF